MRIRSILVLASITLASCSLATVVTAQDAKSPTTPAATQHLPTQRDAAWKVKRESTHVDGPTLAEIEAGVDVARHKEMDALKSGHPELVAPEDVEDCKRVITRELEAETKAKASAELAKIIRAEQAEVEEKEAAKLKADLRENHCPPYLKIGTSETCVYLMRGYPNHINEDLRSGKQLVYNDEYIYIDLHGRVENIQTSY